MGWSVSYQPIDDESLTGTPLGDFDTFPEAIRTLKTHVEKLLKEDDSDESLMYLLEDIKDISEDPGIMGDVDQWEDWDFSTETTAYYVESY